MLKHASSTSPKSNRAALAVLAAVTLLAVLLQLSRVPFRWNPIALAYAAYFHEFRHVIELQGWSAALTTFVGLHPPAYSLLFLGLMEARVPAACWLGMSGMFSVASVPLVWATATRSWGRGGILGGAGLAALVLAISPHRNAYGLEVNNYPLLVAATAAQLLAFARLYSRPTKPRGMPVGAEILWIATTALALWTHVLSVALPLSQLGLLAALPEGREGLRRFCALLAAVGVLCLPLVPGLLASSGGDPLNPPAGLMTALSVALADYPGRYGSETGANLMALLAAFGLLAVVRAPRGERLVPLSWLAHAVVAGALILALVSRGIAAAHQFPYYLVLLPAGALLVAAALRHDPRRPAALQHALRLGLAVALLLHLAALSSEALRARQLWAEAPQERGLVALAVESWSPNSALLLVNFPRAMDDDKDHVDASYALLPMSERLTFAQPAVATLVPGDPMWGQPIQFENDRWLYTFTGFREDRVDAIADATLEAGGRVILAVYETEFAEHDVARIRAWASQRGEPGRRAPGQLMFILEPPARPAR
jgi:hypothetical protein